MSNDKLVDLENEVGNVDRVRKQLTEAVATPQAPEPEATDEPKEPQKYQGKTREEIIEMHRNAERKIGQTGNELGQYKQLTDQLLDLKRRDDLSSQGVEVEEEPLPKITSEEILDDPDAAIEKAVEARL